MGFLPLCHPSHGKRTTVLLIDVRSTRSTEKRWMKTNDSARKSKFSRITRQSLRTPWKQQRRIVFLHVSTSQLYRPRTTLRRRISKNVAATRRNGLRVKLTGKSGRRRKRNERRGKQRRSSRRSKRKQMHVSDKDCGTNEPCQGSSQGW
jgi:hypothetical protein